MARVAWAVAIFAAAVIATGYIVVAADAPGWIKALVALAWAFEFARELGEDAKRKTTLALADAIDRQFAGVHQAIEEVRQNVGAVDQALFRERHRDLERY